MKKAFVYPDNSVSIDGKNVVWTERDFRRLKIEPVRRASSLQESDNGRKIETRDTVVIVFPTIPITRPLKT